MHLTGLFRGLARQAAAPAPAPFTTSFSSAAEGSPIQLQWAPLDASVYPVTISVRLINRTDNGLANGMQLVLAPSVNSSSFTWDSPPNPLPYLDSALYAIDIRPTKWNASSGAQPPVLVKSDFFPIKSQRQPASGAGSSPGPATTSNTAASGNSSSGGSGGGPGGPNTVAIAVGLAVGIPAIIVVGFLVHRWQKRRRMVKEAVMEKRRAELVIE